MEISTPCGGGWMNCADLEKVSSPSASAWWVLVFFCYFWNHFSSKCVKNVTKLVTISHYQSKIWQILYSWPKSFCQKWSCLFPSGSIAAVLHPFFQLCLGPFILNVGVSRKGDNLRSLSELTLPPSYHIIWATTKSLWNCWQSSELLAKETLSLFTVTTYFQYSKDILLPF